ncbi:hypothetical protein [Halobacillus salinus]|uniref:hypothetical protein n=1 Tax=Halobacillus salinus TaxID=192814 RepID=UPI0009A734D8|nr:hypothetical protein [Halobacillus salinus]
MKQFIKLNIFSIWNAFVLFLAVEIGVNVHRIGALLRLELDVVMRGITYLYIIGFILFSFLFFQVAKKWMEQKKTYLWSIILWAPYFVLFTYIFVLLFPIKNPGYDPGPGAGIVIVFTIMAYPFYLLLLNLLGTGIGREKRN